MTLKTQFSLMPTKKPKSSRGGVRPGAGAPAKYGEATTTVAFRCPVSKVGELKTVVKDKLAAWEKKPPA
jgi:hypothetical protein